MSEDTVDDGGGADNLDAADEVSPEILREAKTLGWVPKDQFRGSADDWVDASTFVERGKQVMPILNHNNERLMQ